MSELLVNDVVENNTRPEWEQRLRLFNDQKLLGEYNASLSWLAVKTEQQGTIPPHLTDDEQQRLDQFLTVTKDEVHKRVDYYLYDNKLSREQALENVRHLMEESEYTQLKEVAHNKANNIEYALDYYLLNEIVIQKENRKLEQAQKRGQPHAKVNLVARLAGTASLAMVLVACSPDASSSAYATQPEATVPALVSTESTTATPLLTVEQVLLEKARSLPPEEWRIMQNIKEFSPFEIDKVTQASVGLNLLQPETNKFLTYCSGTGIEDPNNPEDLWIVTARHCINKLADENYHLVQQPIVSIEPTGSMGAYQTVEASNLTYEEGLDGADMITFRIPAYRRFPVLDKIVPLTLSDVLPPGQSIQSEQELLLTGHPNALLEERGAGENEIFTIEETKVEGPVEPYEYTTKLAGKERKVQVTAEQHRIWSYTDFPPGESGGGSYIHSNGELKFIGVQAYFTDQNKPTGQRKGNLQPVTPVIYNAIAGAS